MDQYGDERWRAIEGPDNFDVFQRLKLVHQPQATLEGSGSFARDGEEPGALPPFEGDPAPLCQDYLPENILNRPGHRGWFTAVDGRGRIRWYYKEYPDEQWKGWFALVLVAHQTPPEYLAYLRREEIPYLVAGEARVDLRQALEKMKSLLGVDCLISTGGGRLNGALLRLGLIESGILPSGEKVPMGYALHNGALRPTFLFMDTFLLSDAQWFMEAEQTGQSPAINPCGMVALVDENYTRTSEETTILFRMLDRPTQQLYYMTMGTNAYQLTGIEMVVRRAIGTLVYHTCTNR